MDNKTHHKTMRLIAAASLLVLASAAPGCVPVVVWLPDSSGFVYTEPDAHGDMQLVHYDLAKGDRHVLAVRLPGQPVWPAVSPDGKQIAVACLEKDKMQVIIYDLQGNEVHRSAEFRWFQVADLGGIPPTAVFWGADSGKLIVADKVMTAIYDPRAKKLKFVGALAFPFGGTPVRPDGKGFLVTRKGEDHPGGEPVEEVFLVDWNGTMYRIDMTKRGIDFKRDIAPDLRMFFTGTVNVHRIVLAGTSSWRGNVAVASCDDLRITIDTKAGRGTIERIPHAEANIDGKKLVKQAVKKNQKRAGGGEANIDGKKLLKQFVFPENAAKLFVLYREQQKHAELAFQAPGDAKHKSLLTPVLGGHETDLSPSPNQRWVAVSYPEIGTGGKPITLVNSRGEFFVLHHRDAPAKVAEAEQKARAKAQEAVKKARQGAEAKRNPKAEAGAGAGDPEAEEAQRKAQAEGAARSALGLAISLLNGGNVEAAKRRFKEIVDEYPDTEAAKQAKAKLKELQ